MFAMTGTRVRKVWTRPDASEANTCTCTRARAELAFQSRSRGRLVQGILHAGAWPGAPARPWAPCRFSAEGLELDYGDGCYACRAPRPKDHPRQAATRKAHGEVRHRRRRAAVGNDGPGR